MKFTAKNFVQWAQSQVGYCGKKTNAQLDDFTANTSGKYNKYAAEIDNLFDPATKTPLNGRKNGYDWCALFILDGAYQILGNIDEAFARLGQKGNNCAASAPWMAKYCKANGIYDTLPRVGDMAFVTTSGTENGHICIVKSVNKDDTITTIDGNWGFQVREVTREFSAFTGFAHPRFDEEDETITLTKEEYESLKAQIDAAVKLSEEYKISYNDLRNRVDRFLEALNDLTK